MHTCFVLFCFFFCPPLTRALFVNRFMLISPLRRYNDDDHGIIYFLPFFAEDMTQKKQQKTTPVTFIPYTLLKSLISYRKSLDITLKATTRQYQSFDSFVLLLQLRLLCGLKLKNNRLTRISSSENVITVFTRVYIRIYICQYKEKNKLTKG